MAPKPRQAWALDEITLSDSPRVGRGQEGVSSEGRVNQTPSEPLLTAQPSSCSSSLLMLASDVCHPTDVHLGPVAPKYLGLIILSSE